MNRNRVCPACQSTRKRPMGKIPLLGALLALLGMAVTSHAALPQNETKAMSFKDCLAAKEQVIAASVVVSPPEDIIPIVNKSDLTITQVCTAEGVVMITCMKDKHQMVITQAPQSDADRCPE